MYLYSKWTSIIRLTIVLCLLVATTACTGIRAGRVMTCDEIKSENLHTIIRTNPSEIDLTQWVLTEYEGSDPTAAESGQFPFYNFVRWDTDEFEYSAEFDDGALQQVKQRIRGATFTLAQTLECLGQPKYYRTFYYAGGGGGASLTMWYPADGFVLSFTKANPRNSETSIVFQGDEQINSINYTTTTTLEEAIVVEYGEPLTDHAQNVLEAIVPWSADTMPIVVEIPQ